MNTIENVKTTVRKMPEGWKHPQLNLDMGGYWGTYWGERLMFVGRDLPEALDFLEQYQIEYEVIQ